MPIQPKIVKARLLLVFYVGTLVFYNFFNVGHHILHLIPNPWHSHEVVHHHHVHPDSHSHSISNEGLNEFHSLNDHINSELADEIPSTIPQNNLKVFYCFEYAFFTEEAENITDFTPKLLFSLFCGLNLPSPYFSPQIPPPNISLA